MRSIDKRLLRLALAMHARLAHPSSNEPLVELPISTWDRCTELARQVRRARLRNWQGAAGELCEDLNQVLISLADQLAIVRERLPRSSLPSHKATCNDLYADLLAISEEFEEVEFDVRTCQLSVTTEPLTLEGVYLGPFEIRLHSRRSGEYRVIAKDPHPAESRENVTHPHVMDETLCEGDGRHAIRQALAQGRLLDFFTLVAGILRTYNPESPFVELALWHGCSCCDCGTLVDEDSCYSCQKCHANVCSECESVCCGCEDSCCSDCIGSCAACEDNYCRRCLQPCQGCHRFVCSGCLAEDERCPNCHEEESGNDDDREAPATARAAVQSHRLGQAAVPA